MTPLTTLNRILATIAMPNEVIYEPSAKLIAMYNVTPLITNENNPSVKIEIGKDNTFNTGFKVAFRMDKNNAVNNIAHTSVK